MRHGQIVCTGVAPQSSLAQQGMARMRMLVLALGHCLQGEVWPDCIERLVLRTRLYDQSLLALETWPDCVYRRCPADITYTARHGQNENAGADPRSLLARRGMVRLS